MDFLLERFVSMLESYNVKFELIKVGNDRILKMHDLPVEIDSYLVSMTYDEYVGTRYIADEKTGDIVGKSVVKKIKCCLPIMGSSRSLYVHMHRNDYAIKINMIDVAFKNFYKKRSII